MLHLNSSRPNCTKCLLKHIALYTYSNKLTISFPPKKNSRATTTGHREVFNTIIKEKWHEHFPTQANISIWITATPTLNPQLTHYPHPTAHMATLCHPHLTKKSLGRAPTSQDIKSEKKILKILTTPLLSVCIIWR